MFGWLKKEKDSDPLVVLSKSFDVFYPPAEREIYRYWNGREVVRADPMVLYRKLMEVGPELSVAIKVSNSPSKDAGKAEDEVVETVRGMFGLTSFAGGGLSHNGCKELLDNFLGFCEALKKNWSRSSTSSSSSEQEDAGPATPPTLGSGSIGGAPFTAGPPPSPTG